MTARPGGGRGCLAAAPPRTGGTSERFWTKLRARYDPGVEKPPQLHLDLQVRGTVVIVDDHVKDHLTVIRPSTVLMRHMAVRHVAAHGGIRGS